MKYTNTEELKELYAKTYNEYMRTSTTDYEKSKKLKKEIEYYEKSIAIRAMIESGYDFKIIDNLNYYIKVETNEELYLYTCKECKYYNVCGDEARTEPCKGRETK